MPEEPPSCCFAAGTLQPAAMVTGSGTRRVAIIRKDLEGVITGWSKGAERLFGYAADEVVGRPLLLLIPPDCQVQETAILERLRRGMLVKATTPSARPRMADGLR